jgi:hypothetical protein
MKVTIDISLDDVRNKFINNLRKAIQSANINFIFGSGCSFPSIKPSGDIENQIQQEIDTDNIENANKLLHSFLSPFVNLMNNIKSKTYDDNFNITLENYVSFINIISNILFQRKSNISHKQVSVFTTNYDLFFELAYQLFSENMILCDGFRRRPTVDDDIYFSISEFFNSVYNIGNIYNYQVELPFINLIKLHGSLNWQIKKDTIINSTDNIFEANKYIHSSNKDDIIKFLNLFSLILPKKDKFRETIINQTYYDLLRIFSNELDKENTLLLSEGFSFSDEHIYEIIKRSLRNPTLKLVIFCYNKDEIELLLNKFNMFNNVEIIFSSTNNIDFNDFNNLLLEILPVHLQDV